MAGRLQAITTMQGTALARPLWDFNLDQVKAILATLSEDGAFVHATVVGPGNETVATKAVAIRDSIDSAAENRWTFRVPISFVEASRHEELGQLQVEFSKATLHTAFVADVVHSLEAVASVAVVTIFAVLLCLRLIAKKLMPLLSAMEGIVLGDLSVEITGLDRTDEIGAIARAISLLKDAAVEKRRITQASLEASARQAAVVDALASGLSQLASGNLTCSLASVFGSEYDRISVDFNSAVSHLRSAMGIITDNTHAILAGSQEISSAADDLCMRTQRHAASLEETASSMNLLARNVKQTSTGAMQARNLVSEVKTEVECSGTVVTHAVAAMGRIKSASHQIAQIIQVIDGLTMRTNMLALNATIEAARAGDSGLGFAVVAMEVRLLARQCSESADKIKALIIASSVEVDSGVALVGKTGTALAKIACMVAEVDAVVQNISDASRDQADGLAMINVSVGEMDDVTQQNAVMIEEVTASAHGLSREMESLTGMVSRFRIEGASVQEHACDNAAA